MGLLADLFSAGDTAKRRLRGLLDDPAGTLGLGATRFGEDQAGLLGLMDQAGYTPGSKSVLLNDKAAARTALADKSMESFGGLLGTMSKADAIAGGFWHPVGDGKKLRVPVQEMSASRVPIMDLPERRFVSPESMYGGRLVPAAGDRSAAGSLLTEVNGIALPNSVKLEGGADFMRTHDPHNAAWASDKGVITSLSKKVRAAAEGGKDVYMPYVAMGHGATNFNTMMSDALLEQIRGSKINKKAISAFDKEVKSIRPEFLGLNHPDVRAQLEGSGALRHVFNNRMELDQFKNAGFPDLASTRNAITEPLLRDVPLHSAGFSIAKMDRSGRVISNPVDPHTTYNTQLGGNYFGALEKQIPRDLMFSDFYRARRAAGLPVEGDARSFQLSNPIQDANQQWLDGVMGYLDGGLLGAN